MSDMNKTEAAARQALGDFQAMGDAAGQTSELARTAGADALNQARDVARDAQARAASTMHTLSDQASSVAETQKSHLADQLEDVAKAVHRSGTQLEGHQDWVAHMVERGAAELSALATTLRTNDLRSLLGELGSLANRQPALFVGASMAAGFALTRVGRLAVSGTAPAAAPRTPSPAPHSPAPSPAATSGAEPAATSEAGGERR